MDLQVHSSRLSKLVFVRGTLSNGSPTIVSLTEGTLGTIGMWMVNEHVNNNVERVAIVIADILAIKNISKW